MMSAEESQPIQRRKSLRALWLAAFLVVLAGGAYYLRAWESIDTVARFPNGLGPYAPLQIAVVQAQGEEVPYAGGLRAYLIREPFPLGEDLVDWSREDLLYIAGHGEAYYRDPYIAVVDKNWRTLFQPIGDGSLHAVPSGTTSDQILLTDITTQWWADVLVVVAILGWGWICWSRMLGIQSAEEASRARMVHRWNRAKPRSKLIT
jgi:hypothetical protein